jgi:hypothetical protein
MANTIQNIQNAVQGAVQQAPPPSTAQAAAPQQMTLPRTPGQVPAAAAAPLQPKPKPSFSDFAHESMINGMLANPSTPLLSVTTNTMAALMSGMDTSARVLTSAFNDPKQRTSISEAIGGWMGLISGIGDSIRYTSRRITAAATFKDETSSDTLKRLGINSSLTNANKIDLRQRTLGAVPLSLDPDSVMGKITDFLGSVQNAPGTLLNEIDVNFKIAQASRVLNERAVRAVKNGEYPDVAQARAALADERHIQTLQSDEADYYTYMNKASMPSLSWVTDKSVEKIPMLRFVMPFKRAIAASLEQTIERSPIRFLSPELNRQFFNPDPEIRAAAQARFLTGAALTTTLGFTLKDHVNGIVPSDPSGRLNPKDIDRWEKIHGPQNSLIIDDPAYGKVAFQLDHMGVPGQYLKMIARIRQWNSNLDRDKLYKPDDPDVNAKLIKEYSAMLSPVVSVLYDQYWAKNIVEFSGMIEDVTRTGNSQALIRYMERMGTKMIPLNVGGGWTKAVAKIDDPHKHVYDKFGDEFKATFDATSEFVRYGYDWEGAKMWSDRFVGPGSTQVKIDEMRRDDPTAKYLDEINAHIREPEDVIRAPQYPNGYPGPVIKFTDDEWAAFNKLSLEGDPSAGVPGIRSVIDSMRNNPTMRTKLTKAEQAHIVERTYSDMQQKYKDYMLKLSPDLLKRYTERIEAGAEAIITNRNKRLGEQ